MSGRVWVLGKQRANTGHTFDLAVQLRMLEEAFPNLMVAGSRLWIELAFLLDGREKMKTPLNKQQTREDRATQPMDAGG